MIVERAPNAGRDVPVCNKRKFLVPSDISVSAFVFEIRKHMPEIDANQTIYVFVDNTLPPQCAIPFHFTLSSASLLCLPLMILVLSISDAFW